MKVRTGALVLTLALGCALAIPSHAADQDRDRDNRAVSDRDDAAFANNKFFQEGWKDGLKHKHKNRKFKNDEDSRAYEAGYAHGDRGEQWHKPNARDRDHDQH
jgi:hypothetical protein